MAEYKNILQDTIQLGIIKIDFADYRRDIKVKKSDINYRVREKQETKRSGRGN